jgi:hypothetical protein
MCNADAVFPEQKTRMRISLGATWRNKMRNVTLIGIAALVGTFALAQSANAERVCKSVCEGASCVQKCVEHDDTVVIDRDRDRVVHEHDRPAIELRGPGIGVDIGR